MNYIRILIISILFISSITKSLCDEFRVINSIEEFGLNARGGFQHNIYTANFSHFQDAIDCGVFKFGNGLGYVLGVGLEYPLLSQSHLGLAVFISDRSGTLKLNSSFRSYDTTLKEVIVINTENRLKVRLLYIDIQSEFYMLLMKNLFNGPLRSFFSLRMSLPLEPNFEQKETILSPQNAVFNINGIRTRNRIVSNGNISTISSPVFGIGIGLENMLDIGNNNFLTQKLGFDYCFNNLTRDVEWKTYALRLELGLRFSFSKISEKITTPPIEKTIEDTIITKEEITAEESTIPQIYPMPQLAISEKSRNLEILTGNELLATPPIVNAIFFERNSAEIPKFYELQKGLESYYDQDPVYIHKYILPRIVDIIKKNPNSRIILEGTTSGSQYEPEGLSLSRKRAEAVQKAFIDLGVAKNLISIEPRIFPRVPSNQEFEKGVIENQRVDILVIDAPLQEYMNVQKYAELNGTIEFFADFTNIPVGHFVHFKSNFSQDSVLVEKPKIIPLKVKQRLQDDKGLYHYFGFLKSDTLTAIHKNLIELSKLSRRQVELSYDRFEAVLTFDYDRSELSNSNKGLLKQLAEFLPDGFTIVLFGSADALGSEQRNIQLERERADAAENYIRSITPKKFKFERITEYFNKYSEETPQGRFLNRSIRIKLKR